MSLTTKVLFVKLLWNTTLGVQWFTAVELLPPYLPPARPRQSTHKVSSLSRGARSSDLAFDVEAYSFIILNNVFTAANNVYTKKKLGSDVSFTSNKPRLSLYC